MNLTRSIPKLISLLRKPQSVNINPENIQVDITTSCNLRCKMCPRYVLEKEEQNKSISLDVFKKLIDDIMPGSVNLAATGEPFIHPDFFEMVKYSKQKSGAVTLTSSNFTAVTPKTIENIISSGLDILKVSIDSPDAVTYKAIRGQDYLFKVLENIRALNEAKTRTGSAKPSLRIDYVVMKENLNQMKAMIDLSKELKADAVLFRLLDTSRVEDEVKSGLLSGFEPEDIETEMREALAYAKDAGVKTNLVETLDNPDYIRIACGKAPLNPLKRGVCLLPWLQLFITVSGDVSPCCSLYPSGKLEEGGTGNLFKSELGTAWNGEKMRALRKLFKSKKNYEAFRACAKCNPMDMKNLFKALKMFPGIIKIKNKKYQKSKIKSQR